MTLHYIYKTIIFTDTTKTVGIDITQNDLDVSDFETNNKSDTVSISEVIISETVILTHLSYTDFKTKVTAWSDVQCIDDGKSYELYLISDTQL